MIYIFAEQLVHNLEIRVPMKVIYRDPVLNIPQLFNEERSCKQKSYIKIIFRF